MSIESLDNVLVEDNNMNSRNFGVGLSISPLKTPAKHQGAIVGSVLKANERNSHCVKKSLPNPKGWIEGVQRRCRKSTNYKRDTH